MPHLPITRERLLALLLIVFGVRVLAPPNGSLVNLNPRVSILHHHPPLGCGFLAIFRKLSFHYRLHRKWAKGNIVSRLSRTFPPGEVLTRSPHDLELDTPLQHPLSPSPISRPCSNA